MKRKVTILEYDVLRVIVTLLVIIGHCRYYKIITPYGGCDYSRYTEAGIPVFCHLETYINDLIYAFHMPLYMALSGALYCLKKARGGVQVIQGINSR